MYREYYNLTKNPFENTPDPRFLFLSKQHKEVLSSLLYGVKSAKGFVLVTGDVGTGKTTLIHVLLRNITYNNYIIHVANPRIEFNDILNYLANKIGIALEGKSTLELFKAIGKKLKQQDKIGKQVVLIIDEAHLLSEDSLQDIRLISNLESTDRKLVQIILVGQDEIYNQLQKHSLRSLKQRIVINRKLTSLNEAETNEYIKHRLRVAGTDARLFEKGALSLIYRHGNGIPRLINLICDNALLIGLAEEKKSIGVKIIKEVLTDMEIFYEQPKAPASHKQPQIQSSHKQSRIQSSHKQSRIQPSFSHWWSRFGWIGVTAAVILAALLVLNHRYDLTTEINKIVEAGFSSDIESASVPDKEEAVAETANETAEFIVSVSEPRSVGKDDENSFDSQVDDKSEKELTQSDDSSELVMPVSESRPGNQSNENSFDPKVDDKSEVESIQSADNPNIIIKEEKTDGHVIIERVEANLPLIDKPMNQSITGDKTLIKNQKEIKLRDNLYRIALAEYSIFNDTVMDFIQMANPDIRNFDLVYIDQKIKLPQIRRKDLIVEDKKGAFHIHYSSHYQFEDAQNAVQSLLENGMEAFLIPSYQSDSFVYRVYCGIFSSRLEAEVALEKIYFKFLPFIGKQKPG